ncbi:MAG: hypothetical protein PWP24_1111 [Clostridiales bacterium]|nr:hypothetical protein [Clostridiales bacterium]
MNSILLSEISLFKDIPLGNLSNLINLEICSIVTYNKNTIVVQENDSCTSIGIVLSGSLVIQQLTEKGDSLTINILEPMDIFGAAIYGMAAHRYPFTVTTRVKSQVMYLPFSEIKSMLAKNEVFTKNFIQHLSCRVFTIQKKIKMLQNRDVRSRLIFYLSNEYQIAEKTTFPLRHSKIYISDLIGVARPSVSRELKHMEADGLILLSGNEITLRKPALFSSPFHTKLIVAPERN